MLTSRQESGRRAEELATQFLCNHGLRIIERNYRRRFGELDIIARGPDVLVVAEVRSRASAAFGGAAASVGWRKRQRITRTATALLQQHHEFARLPVRFDVLIVSDPLGPEPRIEWLQHAFEAC
ncbi:MAG: YraN family protein [Steroidobacterales bacterium]|jgi:putative endonuclease